MIKDITIGQYFPGKSVIHRMDPRMKLILTTLYIVMLFVATNISALAIGVTFLCIVYPMSKISYKMVFKSLKPILPIIILTTILNAFFIPGNILWQWWVIKVTDRGLMTAALMCIRLMALIAGTSLMTYTTSPTALTDAIERLFSPLKRFNISVHETAMMMTIALRFIPTLIEETDKIMSAQKARGADMESGNLLQRVKALIPILIPLFVSAFRRADELALAMECRCYHGGDGRTRMRQLHIQPLDIYSAVFTALCFAATIIANIYAPGISVR